MTRGKGKNEEDECIDQVQSEVQRGRVPTYIGGASPINDCDVYVQKWEVISNRLCVHLRFVELHICCRMD
jgi:hypothetical protein